MRRHTFFILVTAWILGSFSQVQGSQGVPYTVEQLAARADRVIHAKVLSKTCLRNERGEIYTRIEVEVYEVWKGPATNRFVIVQAGGVLGDEAMEAVGQQGYQPGEEIVDCLMLNQRGEGVSIAACRGKFTVMTDPKTGQKRARNLFWQLAPTRVGAQIVSGHSLPPPIALEDLQARMTGALK
jgi:hypothetical protein